MTRAFIVITASIFLLAGRNAWCAGQSDSNPTQETTTHTEQTSKTDSKYQQTKRGSKSESKNHETRSDRHDRHSGGGMGVGGTIDLGGVGQRTAEPDPFAVGRQPVTRSEGKPKSKRTEHDVVGKGNPFADVSLTSAKAKGRTEDAAAYPFSDVELTGPHAKGDSKQ